MTLHAVPESAPTVPAPEGDWQYGLRLHHDDRAPGIARAVARIVLHERGLIPLIDSAELVCSELVTNAVRYSTGDLFLRLKGDEDKTLRLSVHDTNPHPPTPATPDQDDTHGRGLLIVRSLAHRWGIYDLTRTSGGKVVWAELRK
ncbi:ATP-binding protein [Streptomyces sp. N2-109]|uniref:ATP-binding protein n=1 Tax=Streptomyces gossypii TaxID=2883101 RepID=A0ABT2JVR3_9ACTN|nr:ATP-binding protein [Streptomyces gossypii]MCT2592002.1 ATP-binding protein [Streptomyces gossypii]